MSESCPKLRDHAQTMPTVASEKCVSLAREVNRPRTSGRSADRLLSAGSICSDRVGIRDFDDGAKGVRDDSVSILGCVLVAHRSGGRRVSCSVHELDCGCSCGGRQSQTRVSKIVESQVCPADACSCALPGDLQYVGGQWHTSDSYEHEIVGSGTGEASQVITDSRNESLRDGNRSSARLRLWCLDQRFPSHRDGSALLHVDHSIAQIHVPSP